ncbi:FAD-dependent oxidoreductase [Nonomuraea rhizosphaerae]|uniref:FAD-dependent oxidoreductase n=1 Tax=Nonomuraea rhizosphaerae TaxID=2665663 RepID=UPI001C5F29AE|nr:NAD(P)/FAD-dependent oxidoreductase [Nonomuraea rhizosphaerae]
MNTRIAVIGAGPGGLTCAAVLRRHGVEVTVHDLDASAGARDQGGTLDMHADTGQIALREAGLIDGFFALARSEGQSKRMLSRHGEVLGEHLPQEGEDAAPEIDRGQLRALLAGSLEPGTVRWGHRLTGVTPGGDGTHLLTFADGTRTVADLVVGADGAWSRVRPLVSGASPVYTGVTFVEACYDNVDLAHPVVAELVGDGHMFATGDGKGLIAQRNSGQHVRAYIAMRTGEDWHRAAGIDPGDTAAVREALLKAFAGWDERLLTLITGNDGPYVSRPLYELPTPHTWPHTPGVTLLGDAAHLMSPFGGLGANLAMLDGSDLALAVARHDTVDEAITAYEEVMLPRAIEATGQVSGVLDRVFGPGDRGAGDAPDFEREGREYKRRAAEHLQRSQAR